MPRPKRTKVASTTARVAKTSKDADPTPPQQPVAKAGAKKVPGPQESFSDDSDGLVVKSTRPRRRMPWQPEPQKDVDLTMTGALPVDNEGDIPRQSIKNRTPSSRAAKSMRPSKSSVKNTSMRKPPTVQIPRKSRSSQLDVDDSPAQEEDSSGFGDNLLTFTSLDSDSPAHGTRPPSAIKVGATPAHETSILALTNFKRRARQPSLLRMVHQTTDVEDNDLDDLGDFDDFPDAESTPLHVQKSTPALNTGNDSGLSLSSSDSRGTKRKRPSPVVQVPRSSPPYDPLSGPDVAESRSSSPSLPEVVHSTEEAHQNQEDPEPEIFSETMAPPMSSSDYRNEDIEDPAESPARSPQRRRRGLPTKADKDAEDSEGEETDRPRKARGRQTARAKQNMSTAKLQAMLPRRRTRMPVEEDEFDIPGSEAAGPVDSDEDELQAPPRRQTVASRKSAAPKPAKKPSRAGRKSKAPPKPAPKNTKTYGRRTSSDKENGAAAETDDDFEEVEEPTEVSIVETSAKLAAIAKKFEEVDEFEMDFESVSFVPDSSSPWR